MGILDWLDPTRVPVPAVEAMPDATPPESAPYSKSRPIVASAKKYNMRKDDDRNEMANRPYSAWQQETWLYYDAIGEIKYAFNLVGAVFSRLRLYPALIIDEDTAPVSIAQFIRRQSGLSAEEKVEDARDRLNLPEGVPEEALQTMREYVDALGSGHGGITGLLRTFALNMSVPGEVYLVNIDGRWSMRSTDEIQVRSTDRKPVLKNTRQSAGTTTTGTMDKELPSNTWIGRIWRPHPRYSNEPDSSMLALREMCDELLTLQRMIRATARSKMNAGMVFVPDGITAAGATIAGGEAEDENEDDAFIAEFIEAMTAPVTDESSAATVVPMLTRGPDELGQYIKFTDFSRDSDKALVDRADRTLERVLQGIDVPKDIVTGLANVKYSNAIQIDDSLYKSHIEPMALILCDALTMMYIRPAVKKKHPDITDEALRRIAVWYDPSEVVTRVNPAESANQGYDRFALSADAWRRAHGFSDVDKPNEDELALRLAMEKSMIPPEVVTELIRRAVPSVLNKQIKVGGDVPKSAQDLLNGPSSPPSDSSTSMPDNAATPDDGASGLILPGDSTV